MFDSIVHFFIRFLENSGPYAYLILFFLTLLERAAFTGVILPGGYILIVAGFVTAHGYLRIPECLAATIVGALTGDCLGYLLGRKLGREYFDHHKRLLLLKRKHIEVAEDYFRDEGGKTILIGRFVSVLHMVVPFVCGLSRMVFKRFLAFDVAGNIGWGVLFIGLGYLVGWSSLRMGGWLLALGLFFLVVLGSVVTSFVLSRRYKARHHRKS